MAAAIAPSLGSDSVRPSALQKLTPDNWPAVQREASEYVRGGADFSTHRQAERQKNNVTSGHRQRDTP